MIIYGQNKGLNLHRRSVTSIVPMASLDPEYTENEYYLE